MMTSAARVTCATSPCFTRSCNAIVSARVAVTISLSRKAILLEVRAELFGRYLHRLGYFRLHANLHRVVLAQRKAFPVFGHQQTTEIGMAVEDDTEEIPDFAFEPVGRRPDVGHGRDAG